MSGVAASNPSLSAIRGFELPAAEFPFQMLGAGCALLELLPPPIQFCGTELVPFMLLISYICWLGSSRCRAEPREW